MHTHTHTHTVCQQYHMPERARVIYLEEYCVSEPMNGEGGAGTERGVMMRNNPN